MKILENTPVANTQMSALHPQDFHNSRLHLCLNLGREPAWWQAVPQVNNLIDVVKEQDQIILKLEKKEKEKEEESIKVKEKFNVITKLAGLLLQTHYKDLIPKLGITQDQIPTYFNGYNFDL